MPDRPDWDEARRRDLVRKQGGVPAWSDMGSDVVSKRATEAVPNPGLEARRLLASFCDLDVPDRRLAYKATLVRLDAIYTRARKQLQQLPEDRRGALRRAFDREQFQRRGDLLRASGLSTAEALELLRKRQPPR